MSNGGGYYYQESFYLKNGYTIELYKNNTGFYCVLLMRTSEFYKG